MFHITSSLVGGLAAVTAWALVAPGFEHSNASIANDSGQQQVNRVTKSDRVSAPRATVGDRTVSTVEVIGVHDAAIVYRDRDGRVLFQTEPLTNVTVISKGVVLPQVTVRETPRSTPAPVVVPRKLEATPAIPVGCDPVASPIAEPALARVTGRCLS
jgi:hypothetical protein